MFKWINDESNSSWISLKCFQVSNSCLMDLGCPLLLGSSVRRLRRRAATVTASLNKQLELLCDALNELRKSTFRRSNETSDLIQGSKGPQP